MCRHWELLELLQDHRIKRSHQLDKSKKEKFGWFKRMPDVYQNYFIELYDFSLSRHFCF